MVKNRTKIPHEPITNFENLKTGETFLFPHYENSPFIKTDAKGIAVNLLSGETKEVFYDEEVVIIDVAIEVQEVHILPLDRLKLNI